MEQFRCLLFQRAINCTPCATYQKTWGQSVAEEEVLIWRINFVLAVQKHIMRQPVVLHPQCGANMTKKREIKFSPSWIFSSKKENYSVYINDIQHG